LVPRLLTAQLIIGTHIFETLLTYAIHVISKNLRCQQHEEHESSNSYSTAETIHSLADNRDKQTVSIFNDHDFYTYDARTLEIKKVALLIVAVFRRYVFVAHSWKHCK
jgi:hypothetical protein